MVWIGRVTGYFTWLNQTTKPKSFRFGKGTEYKLLHGLIHKLQIIAMTWAQPIRLVCACVCVCVHIGDVVLAVVCLLVLLFGVCAWIRYF